MKLTNIFSAAFRTDPRLSTGLGIVYDAEGNPIETAGTDLLTRFIVVEMKELFDAEADTAANTAEFIRGLSGARREIGNVAEIIGTGDRAYLDDLLIQIDQVYPDGFTSMYHDQDGNLVDLDQTGDTLAKWIVYQAVTAVGCISQSETLEKSYTAQTQLLTEYIGGMERISEIISQLVAI